MTPADRGAERGALNESGGGGAGGGLDSVISSPSGTVNNNVGDVEDTRGYGIDPPRMSVATPGST